MNVVSDDDSGILCDLARMPWKRLHHDRIAPLIADEKTAITHGADIALPAKFERNVSVVPVVIDRNDSPWIASCSLPLITRWLRTNHGIEPAVKQPIHPFIGGERSKPWLKSTQASSVGLISIDQ